MKWKGEVQVMLKPAVLDPQGETVQRSLNNLGYAVEGVRVGRFMEVYIREESREKAEKKLQEICHRILANPVMEDYTYVLEEDVS